MDSSRVMCDKCPCWTWVTLCPAFPCVSHHMHSVACSFEQAYASCLRARDKFPRLWKVLLLLLLLTSSSRICLCPVSILIFVYDVCFCHCCVFCVWVARLGECGVFAFLPLWWLSASCVKPVFLILPDIIEMPCVPMVPSHIFASLAIACSPVLSILIPLGAPLKCRWRMLRLHFGPEMGLRNGHWLMDFVFFNHHKRLLGQKCVWEKQLRGKARCITLNMNWKTPKGESHTVLMRIQIGKHHGESSKNQE